MGDYNSRGKNASGWEKFKLNCCFMLRNYGSIQQSRAAVPLRYLFRFASPSDIVLLFICALCALLNGLTLPLTIILYGGVSVAFVNNAIQAGEASGGFKSDNSSNQANIAIQFEKNQDLMGAVLTFCIKTTVLHVFSTILCLIFVAASNRTAENQIYRCRSACLKAMLGQEMAWYDTQNTDGLASRFSEYLLKMQDGIGEKLTMILSNMSSVIFCTAIAFFYGWELTLVTAAAFPVLAFATGMLSKVQISFATQEAKAYADAGSLAEEIIGAIRTVTMFGSQDKEVQNFENALVPALKCGIKRGLVSATGHALMWLITYASYALAFWYGVDLVLISSSCSNGETKYDAGSLNIVFFCILFAAMKAGQILPHMESVNMARVAAVDIYAIIDRDPNLIGLSANNTRKQTEVNGGISFENVTFAYPSRPDVPVLRGVTFTVKAGQTVALVGASGSGKSTCFQLLQRLYDPQHGRILLDGNDISKVDTTWLRSLIGFVGQEPVLFGVSVGENIRYGQEDDRNDSQEDVERAAELASAHSFIVKLPHGYNTLVGERGAQFSAGQKQRIALARALIRRPKILLLDEATSALDSHSETLVQKALHETRNGRTTLIAAHRLSTIKSADNILVFKDGAIEEAGSHETLMAKRGLYYELVKRKTMDSSELKNNIELRKHTSNLIDEIPKDEIMRNKEKTEVRDAVEKGNNGQLHSNQNNLSAEDPSTAKEVSLLRILATNQSEFVSLLLGLTGSILMGVSTPLYAVIFGEVMGLLSQLQDTHTQERLNFFTLMFLALAFAAALGAFLQTFMFSYAGERLTFRLRALAFQSIVHQKIEWFDNQLNNVGALCARLSSDASAIQGVMGGRLGVLTQISVSITFALLLSFYYERKLAMACALFVPLVLLSAVLEMKINMGLNGSRTKALEKSSTVAVEAISNIRTVISLAREKTFHSKYMNSLIAPYKMAKRNSYSRGLIFGLTSNASSFASIVCMGYGGYLVQREHLDYKYVFIICEALIFGMEMIGQTISFSPDYGEAKAAANRVFSLIDSDPRRNSEESHAVGKTGRVEGSLNFENVYFSYPTRKNVQVLKGFKLGIQAGQTVALVGSSGCGKSTCVELLQRFYYPDSGHILLDGENVRSTEAKSYRSHIGVVSQEPSLFNRTIAENIAYGDQARQVNMDEVIEAARKANIHQFVTSLPLGYETKVGQRGALLSGGQKQRIAIARILVKNPKILILDEATSALDVESERIIQEALEKASEGRTCVTIAHRLSTVVNADRILVLHQGRIQEEGTHEKLLREGGMYYHLWTLQNSGEKLTCTD